MQRGPIAAPAKSANSGAAIGPRCIGLAVGF